MNLRREHIYMAVGVVVVLLITIIAIVVSMPGSKVNPEPRPEPTPNKHKRCDDTTTVVGNFSVDVCPHGFDKNSPCKLRIGQTVDFRLDFATARSFSGALTHMDVGHRGYVTGACDAGGLKCPVEAGEWRSLVQTIAIEDNLQPRKSGVVQFYLTYEQTNELLVCVEFPVEIV